MSNLYCELINNGVSKNFGVQSGGMNQDNYDGFFINQSNDAEKSHPNIS
jgi:hypothetical protein